MKKIISIVGARPQFIKLKMIHDAIAKYDNVEAKIIHTGQHYDDEMSKVFFDELDIPQPHYCLDIEKLIDYEMMSKVIREVGDILVLEHPDLVIVYGDTNTTLAGAFAARSLNIKLVHVEAGLRCFDMTMSEERNRVIVDIISDFLYCPTVNSFYNLKREGLVDNKDWWRHSDRIIYGDVMYDMFLKYSTHRTTFKLSEQFVQLKQSKQLDNFILCTIHRGENTNNPVRFFNILNALIEINEKFGINIVLPAHPRLKDILDTSDVRERIIVIKPAPYLEMLRLLKLCKFVITDSGGITKESYWSGKYCLVLRDRTEWIELVENGTNFLVDADKEKICQEVENILYRYDSISNDKKFYGDGSTAELIVKNIMENI